MRAPCPTATLKPPPMHSALLPTTVLAQPDASAFLVNRRLCGLQLINRQFHSDQVKADARRMPPLACVPGPSQHRAHASLGSSLSGAASAALMELPPAPPPWASCPSCRRCSFAPCVPRRPCGPARRSPRGRAARACMQAWGRSAALASHGAVWTCRRAARPVHLQACMRCFVRMTVSRR